MARFHCTVGTPEGSIAVREVEAESAVLAREVLDEQGLTVFDVKHRGGLAARLRAAMGGPARQQTEAGGAAAGSTGSLDQLRRQPPEAQGRGEAPHEAAAGGLRARLHQPLFRRQRLSTEDLLLLNQELASLVRAGLPLLRCLDILRHRRAGSVAGGVLDRVRERLAGGSSLSRAFEVEDDAVGIPTLYVTSLAVGEASGDLEAALRRYVAHLERTETMKRRVRGALLYPAALFTVSLAVIGVLVGFVLPRFADFYATYDAELPLPTRVLMGVAGVAQSWGLVGLLLAIAGVAGLVLFFRSDAGRVVRDRWALRLPLAGGLRRLYLDLEATRTLGTLLAGGAPLTEALEVAVRGSDNLVHRQKLRDVAEQVRQGSSLHAALESAGLLDSMGLEMVEVGESTGSLDSMLAHVGDTYDEMLERRLNAAVSLLEPAVLVAMGVFLAAVLLSLYLPLFNTARVIG